MLTELMNERIDGDEDGADVVQPLVLVLLNREPPAVVNGAETKGVALWPCQIFPRANDLEGGVNGRALGGERRHDGDEEG